MFDELCIGTFNRYTLYAYIRTLLHQCEVAEIIVIRQYFAGSYHYIVIDSIMYYNICLSIICLYL